MEHIHRILTKGVAHKIDKKTGPWPSKDACQKPSIWNAGAYHTLI